MDVFKKFSSFFRLCMGCSRPHKIGLCPVCSQSLENLKDPQKHLLDGGLVCTTLFSWNRSSDKYLRSLVYNLKGGGSHVELYKWLAFLVFQNIPSSEKIDSIFYPTKNIKKMCHASQLAYALKEVGVPEARVQPLLLRSQNSVYRKKGRKERMEGRLLSGGDLLLNPGNRTLLVDDVLTTGTTLISMAEVLKKRTKLEAYTLVWREKV